MKERIRLVLAAVLMGVLPMASHAVSLEFVAADTVWVGASVGNVSISSNAVVANATIASATNFAVVGSTAVDFELAFDAGLMDGNGIETSDQVITMNPGLGITGGGSGGLGKNVPEGYTVSVDFTHAGESNVLSVAKLKFGNYGGTGIVSDLAGGLLNFGTADVDGNGWLDVSSLGITITGPQTASLFSVWNNSGATYRLDGVELNVDSPETTTNTPPVIATGPNVVFIICDDLNDSIEGFGGHPQAKTPNVDRLMERGVRFLNAECNVPICGPSRNSLWTGMYAHTTGQIGQNQSTYLNSFRYFPASARAKTIQEHFRDNGYKVYGTGKVFHPPFKDDSVYSPGCLSPVDDNYGPWAIHNGTNNGHPAVPQPWRSRWSSFAPLSDVPNEANYPGGGWEGWNGGSFFYESETNRDLMTDEQSANWAVEQINAIGASSTTQSFFMACGFFRPHNPNYAPKKYFDLFNWQDIILPPYFRDDVLDCATVLWRDPITGERKVNSTQDLLASGGGTDEIWKKYMLSYLACVAFIDDLTGQVIDALEANGMLDNTIIVFIGDHGFHNGEKDHTSKNTPWEEAARIPMVVVAPGVAAGGSTCSKPVSLVDLYPTLIDLCGLPEHPNANSDAAPIDGHSFRPFLEDPVNGVWDGPPVALTSVAGGYPAPDQTPVPAILQHHTVRSERYRYVLCNTGEEELYDQKLDPQEWNNLAYLPDYQTIKMDLQAELLKITGMAIPLFVDQNAAPGGDGRSWTTAFQSIGAAVAASSTGTVIRVAEGTYAEAVSLPVLARLLGGYPSGGGEAEPALHPTVIDVSPLGSGFRPVTAAQGGYVRGFTLTGGDADYGGGIQFADSGWLVECIVAGNQAVNRGGGVMASGSVSIEQCIVADNQSAPAAASGVSLGGGGLYVASNGAGTRVRNCVFYGNSGADAGAVFLTGVKNVFFSNCTFDDHTSANGSTFRIQSSSGCEIRNCIFTRNQAVGSMVDNNGSTLSVNNSLFASNVWTVAEIGGTTTTGGLVAAWPDYVDASSHDYRLLDGSPAIDVGVEGDEIPLIDFDGYARPLDGDGNGTAIADAGAFEYVNRYADSDGDSILDGYEIKFRLNPTVSNTLFGAHADNDSDNLSNYDEFIAGTDPMDPASLLVIDRFFATNGILRLEWKGGTDSMRVVESTSSLTNTVWTPVYTNTAGFGEAVNYTPPTGETAFYRLRASSAVGL